MDPSHRLPTSSSSSSSSPDTSFPILAISILGILTTAILLVSYYVFVIKCCMSWRRGDVLRRLSSARSRRRHNDGPPLAFFATVPESHGLDEPTIQSIPTIRFRKQDARPYYECAVCLNEFQEEEKLRLLPSCSHAFHIDCIDTWLQSNANCPLCRSDIASSVQIPTHLIAAREASDDNQSSGIIVIEVREESSDQNLFRETSPRSRPARSGSKKGRKVRHGTSMGDECIDVRGKDEQFSAVQPIRRSFSMDSSCDRQLYESVQEILQRNNQVQLQYQDCGGGVEGCSSGSGGGSVAKIRRSFLSFGHGRTSRSAILPVQTEI